MQDNPYDDFLSALRFIKGSTGRGFGKELAYKTGISTSSITRILKGDVDTPLDQQTKIANALGMTFQDFLAYGARINRARGPNAEKESSFATGDNSGVVIREESRVYDPGTPTPPGSIEIGRSVDHERAAMVSTLLRILDSGDDVMARAIKENLKAFSQALDYRVRIRELENEQAALANRVTALEKAAHHKEEPETVKKDPPLGATGS